MTNQYFQLISYEAVLKNISRLNKLVEPKHQLNNFSGHSDKNGRFKFYDFLNLISGNRSAQTRSHITPKWIIDQNPKIGDIVRPDKNRQCSDY